MQDQFQRNIDYLRISVTDRCNLRCKYCMPSEGVAWMPHEAILTFEEILRIMRISTQLGPRRFPIASITKMMAHGANKANATLITPWLNILCGSISQDILCGNVLFQA